MWRSVLFACLFALVPGSIAAQVAVEAVEVSGGYFAWGGSDLDGFKAGPRGQLTLLLDIGAPFDFGVAGTYGRGGIEDLDPSYSEVGFGATARTTFGPTDRLYASLYAGWIRLSVDLEPTSRNVETNGFAIGPSLGIILPMGGFGLALGGEALWLSMGDVQLAQGGPGIAQGGAKGWRFGAEVGLLYLP